MPRSGLMAASGKTPPTFASSSAMEPTHSRCGSSTSRPSSNVSTQMGSGVPQKRERDSAQSTLFSSHCPNRPVPMPSGCQLMVRFRSTIRSLTSVVRMNQLSTGYCISGVPLRQSCG